MCKVQSAWLFPSTTQWSTLDPNEWKEPRFNVCLLPVSQRAGPFSISEDFLDKGENCMDSQAVF